MNGAQSLIRMAAASGLDVCFCNPGTTELAIIAALEATPEIRIVLGLFEGVVTGAADGYARMSGRPALTILHQGAGLAYGLANLHNARRAGSPVLNLVGDQPSWHRRYDPPLSSDIASLAGTVGWVKCATRSGTLAYDFAGALAAALGPPAGVATLIVPADCQWNRAEGPAEPTTPELPKPTEPDEASIRRAAAALSFGPSSVLLLGGTALHHTSLLNAAKISAATGCRLMCESFPAKLAYGQGYPKLERWPYMPDVAAAAMSDVRAVVLAGTVEPVSFFGYRDEASRPLPKAVAVVSLAPPAQDVHCALDALAQSVGARAPAQTRRPVPAIPCGALTPRTALNAISALLPEHAVVIDESLSSGSGYFTYFADAAPHIYLSLTGGACGQALPCAVGAAIACPNRKVITLAGDGSSMYTLQALWTQAREKLNVVNIIFSNRSYRILEAEFVHVNGVAPGPRASSLFDLADVPIHWAGLGRSLGLHTAVVHSVEELVNSFCACVSHGGPCVLELDL